jgi:hypothetical protein
MFDNSRVAEHDEDDCKVQTFGTGFEKANYEQLSTAN